MRQGLCKSSTDANASALVVPVCVCVYMQRWRRQPLQQQGPSHIVVRRVGKRHLCAPGGSLELCDDSILRAAQWLIDAHDLCSVGVNARNKVGVCAHTHAHTHTHAQRREKLPCYLLR